MNRRSLALGSSFALVLGSVAPGALAQTTQGMPPVSSPNAPSASPPPAPPPPPPPAKLAPTYVPPPLPRSPTLTAPTTTPGGTSVRQLGEPANSNVDNGGAPPGQLEQRLTALIGRPGGLTAAHVAERARTVSYDVKARKAEADAAGTTVDQATLAYVPRIKGTASYTRTSPVSLDFPFPPINLPARLQAPGSTTLAGPALSFAYPENNGNLQVDVDVPLSDYVLKIAKQHAAAEHSAKAAQLTQRASEAAAASNAQIQYYSWARARLNLVVAEAALENAHQHFGDARAELAAGKASQADLLGIQAQVGQAELLVTRARNAVVLEEDRLRTTLHENVAYDIGEQLLADLPPLDGQEDFNGLLGESLQKRAELLSITETARGLHLQALASKYDVLPKIDGIGNAQYANPNPRYFPPSDAWHGSWAFGAALTWSDTDVLLGATSGSATESRAKATEAEALSMRDGIRDEVMQSWQAVHEAETAIRSTQQSLAAAEESYRVRRALFRADRATSTELSESENALTRARFDLVNARIDLRIARVRLSHATGRDVVSPAAN